MTRFLWTRVGLHRRRLQKFTGERTGGAFMDRMTESKAGDGGVSLHRALPTGLGDRPLRNIICFLHESFGPGTSEGKNVLALKLSPN